MDSITLRIYEDAYEDAAGPEHGFSSLRLIIAVPIETKISLVREKR